jgi:hypothetical protein
MFPTSPTRPSRRQLPSQESTRLALCLLAPSLLHRLKFGGATPNSHVMDGIRPRVEQLRSADVGDLYVACTACSSPA